MLTMYHFPFLVSCRGVHGVGLVRRGEADHLAWWRVLPCFSQELRRGSPPLSVQNEADQCVSIKRKKTQEEKEGEGVYRSWHGWVWRSEQSRTIFLSCHHDLLYLWHIHCRTVKRAVLDP